MKTCWDYTCLAQNGALLSECIQHPLEHHALPMPSVETADLVLGLVHEDPRQRPSLAEIRECQFLQQLDLPRGALSSRVLTLGWSCSDVHHLATSASPAEVARWLARAPRALSAPSQACLSCGGSGCGLCRVASETTEPSLGQNVSAQCQELGQTDAGEMSEVVSSAAIELQAIGMTDSLQMLCTEKSSEDGAGIAAEENHM
eukprot:4502736-Amphidinium_carterae.1